ncbi:hypothetical protein Leryth_017888 [Lithospermum erythrorhizon]|nr:hypothetical protein Leryth_017888 [Lithospermum erythrorhizon]
MMIRRVRERDQGLVMALVGQYNNEARVVNRDFKFAIESLNEAAMKAKGKSKIKVGAKEEDIARDVEIYGIVPDEKDIAAPRVVSRQINCVRPKFEQIKALVGQIKAPKFVGKIKALIRKINEIDEFMLAWIIVRASIVVSGGIICFSLLKGMNDMKEEMNVMNEAWNEMKEGWNELNEAFKDASDILSSSIISTGMDNSWSDYSCLWSLLKAMNDMKEAWNEVKEALKDTSDRVSRVWKGLFLFDISRARSA